MTKVLSPVVIEPPGRAKAAVIWLHGLGADGHDFEPIVPELGLPDVLGVRFIFPHAPHRPVTINQGYVMRAWYDVYDVDFVTREDGEGIEASSAHVADLVHQQIDMGVPADYVILAGFSQGGAIALHAGLRFPRSLGGIMALSSYLPLAENVASEANVSNRGVRIMMAHGDADNVIPIGLGQRSRDSLMALGYLVDWHTYPMAHSVCFGEIRDIGDWLIKRLNRSHTG